jgi:hypothetical protein
MNNFASVLDWLSTPAISQMVLIFIFAYLVLLWVALIVWTAKDIISRTNNLALQIFSIALSVIMNVFGLVLYLAIRPSKTLIAKFFEDLEYEALVEEANRTTWEQENQEKKKAKIIKKAKKKNEKKQKKDKEIKKNIKKQVTTKEAKKKNNISKKSPTKVQKETKKTSKKTTTKSKKS